MPETHRAQQRPLTSPRRGRTLPTRSESAPGKTPTHWHRGAGSKPSQTAPVRTQGSTNHTARIDSGMHIQVHSGPARHRPDPQTMTAQVRQHHPASWCHTAQEPGNNLLADSLPPCSLQNQASPMFRQGDLPVSVRRPGLKQYPMTRPATRMKPVQTEEAPARTGHRKASLR